MNLTISNLAWDFDEINDFSFFLKTNKIQNIEIVFSKYEKWSDFSDEKIFELKSILSKFELNAVSTQSLFHGIDCVSFIEQDDVFINHLIKVIYFCKIIGVKILVFGSPFLRKKTNDFEPKIFEIFNRIDLILKTNDLFFCIEPNSKIYGGEFFFNTYEIIDFLKKGNFSNIFTMIDTHNSELENLDPCIELEQNFNYIKHIHVSEKKLGKIDDLNKHILFKQQIDSLNYDGFITYEVLKTNDIQNSIKNFINLYK
jgi:sugar phosphate isomerase/epimerase